MKYLKGLSILLAMFASCNPQPQAEKENSEKYAGPLFNEHIRKTEARTPAEERNGFKLPEGFKIELYASEPDIGKPMNISFDNKGRLWVSQSHEYPFPAEPGEGADRISILEDTDHDGKADKFIHFEDTLNIPIGVLPVNEDVYAYSIPNLFKFEGNKGAQPAKSKPLFGPFGHKDTHGMVNNLTRGYDGWIYVCHGYTNTSTIAGTDGDSISMTSGNTFRIKPNGSRVEQHTFGQVNPFGLTFDEYGYMYSTDCHTSPIYQLISGADYPHFNKKEVGIGFGPDTKPMGEESTALCGIEYYTDTKFPEEYQHNFFIGDVVTCRVHRNSFEFKGSTPIAKAEEDFVKSEDPWFRPVDVKLGPDGALYIADFYNSIIGHYEVPLDHPKRDKVRGRIWRITYEGQSASKTEKLTNYATASLDVLLQAIQNENLETRIIAADEIVARFKNEGASSIKNLLGKPETSAMTFAHGLWILERTGALESLDVQKALDNNDPVVVTHLMRIFKERNGMDESIRPIIVKALDHADFHVQRAAVEALGTFEDLNTIEKLVEQRKKVPDYDTHYLYTVRLTLRNLMRNESLVKDVIAKNWENEDKDILAESIIGVNNEYAGIYLFDYLKTKTGKKNSSQLLGHAVRYVPAPQVPNIISLAKQDNEEGTGPDFYTFSSVKEGLAQRGYKPNADFKTWGKTIVAEAFEKYNPEDTSYFKKQDPDLNYKIVEMQRLSAELIGEYAYKDMENELLTIVRSPVVAESVKVAAAKSLLQLSSDRNAKVVAALLADEVATVNLKKQIVNTVSELPANVGIEVLKNQKNWPPDLQTEVARTLASSVVGKNILLEKVKAGAIFPRILLQPQVNERLVMNISANQKKKLDEITAELPSVSEEREKLITNRLADFTEADSLITEGKILFTQNCSPCHQIDNEGGSVGPQLTGIGNWGAKALTEKIMDPNRNISGAFQNYTIKLKNGQVMTGLFRRDDGNTIVFANAVGQEFTVDKAEINEQTASPYTLMPDNFGERLEQNEFNALLTYLLDQKPVEGD